MKRVKDLRTSISIILIFLVGLVMTGCAFVPPLHDAALKGDTATAKELLDKGTNVDKGYPFIPDITPLMYAASKGHLEVVQLLVERGANVNAVFNPGGMNRTPLAFAAIEGNKEVVKYLVDKGANIDKTILLLRKGDSNKDNQIAMDFLLEFKREMADATQQKGVQTTALDRASPIITSDIDALPAIKAKRNKNAYAIVIGIEQYRQKLPKADFATQDAKLVADYLTKALGYPDEHVITLLNEHATNVDFAKYFEKWLPNNVEKDSSVFIYYSGHGAPNAKTGDAYLVPYDGDPSFIEQTGYPLKRMYDSLGKLPAREVIVVIDSCFSGAGGRSVLAKGSRPIVLSVENPILANKNITVLSASAGNQISSSYDDKGHGLLTYFFLKGIKNEDVVRPDGSLEIRDLYNYVKPQVENIARRKYNNEQIPQLIESKKN